MIRHLDTLEHERFGEIHRLEWRLGEDQVDIVVGVNRAEEMAILWAKDHWEVDPDCGVPADWWWLKDPDSETFYHLTALYDQAEGQVAVISKPMDSSAAALALEVDAFLQGLLAPRIRWREPEPAGA